MFTLKEYLFNNGYYDNQSKYFTILAYDENRDEGCSYDICMSKMLSNDYRFVYDRYIDADVEEVIDGSSKENIYTKIYIDGAIGSGCFDTM